MSHPCKLSVRPVCALLCECGFMMEVSSLTVAKDGRKVISCPNCECRVFRKKFLEPRLTQYEVEEI